MRKMKHIHEHNNYDEIDFVILWVDSNDKKWRIKRNKYSPVGSEDVSISRYRDWDNLKYWFRAVEKYAPWVRKIHFVTDSQVPDWLNVHNPRIHLVDHTSFIPADDLPLFNSSAIEIGIHLIPDLSEQFVFFNDDMFLIAPIEKEYYFKQSLPCDTPALTRKKLPLNDDIFLNIRWNDYNIINKYFNKYEVILFHLNKFFNYKYGLRINVINLINLCHLSSKFDGFNDLHVSIPYCKSEWENVWRHEYEKLSKVRKIRFRSKDDLTQWLIRYWRICTGEFTPKKFTGKYFGINKKTDVQDICDAIVHRKNDEICLNDEWVGDGYEVVRDRINAAFQMVFPQKSSFEK